MTANEARNIMRSGSTLEDVYTQIEIAAFQGLDHCTRERPMTASELEELRRQGYKVVYFEGKLTVQW